MDYYNSELFLAGLERAGAEGVEGELSVTRLRGQFGQYQSRWSRLEFASSDDISFNPDDPYDIVGGVFACKVLEEAGTVRFLQIGSGTRGIPRVDWRIRCPEIFLGFKMDPASDVFATLTPRNE